MVDVDLGDEVTGGTGKLGGEVVLAGLGRGAASVGEAEAIVLGVGGEGAHAAIGEGKLAKVEGIGGSCVGHGDAVALVYQYVNILLSTGTWIYAGLSNDCGKGRKLDIGDQILGGAEKGSL